MTYRLTIHKKSTFLHVIVTGENTKENVIQYWKEIHDECLTRKCQKALVEERFEGPRLTTTEVFDVVAIGSALAAKDFTAIAFVDVNTEGDLMQFAETVALNRGLPIALFSSVVEAEKWLLDKDPPATEV